MKVIRRNGNTRPLADATPVNKNRSKFLCLELLENLGKLAANRKIDRGNTRFVESPAGCKLVDQICKFARGPRREMCARQLIAWRKSAEAKEDNLGRQFYNSEADDCDGGASARGICKVRPRSESVASFQPPPPRRS